MDGVTTTVSGEDMPERFRGRREAGRALAGVVKDWQVFLQIAAPWALALAAGLALLEMIDPIPEGTPVQAFAARFGIPSVVVAVMLSIGTVAVAWHRWTILGRRPRLGLAVPDWPALVYTGTLWVFAALYAAVISLAGYMVGVLLEGVAGEAIMIVAAAAVMLMVASRLARSSSRGALGLPALVVGDSRFPPDPPKDDPARGWEKALDLGRGLPRSVALASAPFVVAAALMLIVDLAYLAEAPPRGRFDPLNVAMTTACLLLVFAAVAAAAGCLSSAYLAAKPVMIEPAYDDEDEDEDD